MQFFHKIVADDFDSVNRLILDQIHSNVNLVEDIGNYLIEAGGKRLRPLLVLLVANALNYTGNKHYDLAAIIEFIHSATLLHDDVVDTSDLRRGRLTANAKWGNAPSVLVGDFLYSRAFQMMVAIGNMDIMKVMSDTTNLISEGEVQQLINAKNPNISEASYYEVIHKKTAVLFEGACEAAAILSQSEKPMQQQMQKYGYHLGLAFQLVDDVLDYTGSIEELGKNVGDDLSEGKPTLPLIYAMNNSSPEDTEVITHSIRHADNSHITKIIDIIHTSGALDYTQSVAKDHTIKAIKQLYSLQDSVYKEAMINLAEFSISRST
ncbi:octaprenyl diphosphate synthase [Candidatus Endobugula sertula]|uniref:Octaprenyl diphosphate synthase n=1 Tax=Candidatus Endobugula sertula TaxID=62101 RepID=A0A1D2QNH9_9GAMM|nr:octaprenyl diphosphate synthase [Candidatus Endobugula sertula]